MHGKHEIDLTSGSFLPKLLRFALPVLLSGVLQLAFNAADLIVVGRFCGENALAAVGSNSALVSLLVNVLLGMGTGSSVLTARYYGARDERQMQGMVQTTVLVASVGGIAFALLGAGLSGPLLVLMGTPEEVLPLARLYLQIYFVGLPVMALYNFCSAILRSVGDTQRPLLYMAIAGVLNVLMNLFFVTVCRLSVAGVAIATVASQCVSTFLVLRCLRRSDGIYRLGNGLPRFSRVQFRKLLAIGVPAGIQGSLFSISNVLVQSSVNSFGAVVMAGNSAAASIEAFGFCAQDSVNQAAVASVSQNMGARNYGRTKQAVLYCSLLEVAVSVVISGCFMLFRKPLLGIYTNDTEAIAAGSIRMLVLGAVYFLNGIQNMMTGAIRGHGYSLLPTAITLVGICGFRVLWITTAFAASHDLVLLYLSYPISWLLTSAAQYTCYFRTRKKAFIRNEAQFAEPGL